VDESFERLDRLREAAEALVGDAEVEEERGHRHQRARVRKIRERFGIAALCERGRADRERRARLRALVAFGRSRFERYRRGIAPSLCRRRYAPVGRRLGQLTVILRGGSGR